MKTQRMLAFGSFFRLIANLGTSIIILLPIVSHAELLTREYRFDATFVRSSLSGPRYEVHTGNVFRYTEDTATGDVVDVYARLLPSSFTQTPTGTTGVADSEFTFADTSFERDSIRLRIAESDCFDLGVTCTPVAGGGAEWIFLLDERTVPRMGYKRQKPCTINACGGVRYVYLPIGDPIVSAPTPSVSIEPSFLDFGEIELGATSNELLVTVTSHGLLDANIISVNDPIDGFTLASSSCGSPPTLLPSGSSCTLAYIFRPIQNGDFQSTIEIVSDSPTSPDTVQLLGAGVSAGLALAPEVLNFGEVRLGETSSLQVADLTNVGTTTLTLTGFDRFPEFSIDSGSTTCAPSLNLAPGTSCSVGITFAPSVEGPVARGSLLVSNSPDSPDTLLLIGNGVVSSLDPAADNIDFGEVKVGDTSDSELLALRSAGSATLNVQSISTSADEFTFTGGTCAAPPFALQPGEECELTYDFTPPNSGAFNANIAIISDDPTGQTLIPLSGKGVTAGAALSPGLLDFDRIVVGQSSDPQSVDIRNVSSVDLTISEVIIGSNFSIINEDCGLGALPSSLPASAACTIQVVFNPGSAGQVAQELRILSDASGSPDVVALVGDGYLPRRTFSGPLPSGAVGTISFTTSDPACAFNQDPTFLTEGSAPQPPDSFTPVDGIVDFRISDCAPGVTVDIRFDYGNPLPSGVGYWKADSPWQQIPATVSDSVVSFSITDGGPFDEDGLVNGEIVDPSGALQPASSAPGGPSQGPQAIAVMSRSQVSLLAIMVILLASGLLRQPVRIHSR
ncbi:hypothetical protein NOR51B_1333 [Luminiphilus syltensis NOR5-1B]|uniref:HYDIN/VesB/CFA65-like Ig-like domain-containing protein n=1 Tax=Luminiphilus syltensis NOR5-1B TaxID=565045 RepID=B8KVQ3_9GAMM|nr:choice-of-anchor D domain-containing protein [Luminiphilus syltensis]EED35388.1 hypothetical protein NOR51B_1333 [Luminiphilus syltensis NOR5-1B]